jgi:phosphoglycolate phosphatase
MSRDALIMFDLDGTLVDSRADLTTAVNLMRKDFGLVSLPQHTVVSFVGNGMRALVRRALADSSRPVDEQSALEVMRGHYARHLTDRTEVYPGTFEALDTLRDAGYALAVVTNNPEAPARAVLEALDLLAYFDCVVGGGTCATIKPDPEGVQFALRETRCRACSSWIVGDNVTDLAAGRNAGVRRCYCRFGFGSLDGESYDLAVDTLPEFCRAVL